MVDLFDKTRIREMTLRNRLVRSATWEGMCDDDGRPTGKLINCYRDLAKGGVGLIMTGYTYVRPDGKQLPGKMGIYTDDFANEMMAMTKAVHDAGGKICIQLVHAGGQTDSRNAGGRPVAPSAVQTPQFPEVPRELTTGDITEIIDAFGEAAKRARAWDFDAVQLHGAHGYLINQFLSPHTNQRTDEYGGSLDNRCRFLIEVYRKVRDTVGSDYPVLVKLTGSDFLEGGLIKQEAVYAAKRLSDEGVDAMEVSGGTSASGDKTPTRTNINRPEKEAYNLFLAKNVRKAVTCPVMVVGGFRSYEIADKVINDDGIDYISMARPFIREPDLANRWKRGDTAPAKCISCNSCFEPGFKEGGIYCVVEKKLREKALTRDG
jgi:2,4-dienoyl-CoA reductase-like NADH-dependent reductase (Old Yellow Enzyme family)